MFEIEKNSIQFIIENMKNINTLSISCTVNIETLISNEIELKDYRIDILSSKCWLSSKDSSILFHVEIDMNINMKDIIKKCHTSKCIYLKDIECEQFELNENRNESIPIPCSIKNVGDYSINKNKSINSNNSSNSLGNSKYSKISYQNRVIARIRYKNDSNTTSTTQTTNMTSRSQVVSVLPKESSSLIDTALASAQARGEILDMEDIYKDKGIGMDKDIDTDSGSDFIQDKDTEGGVTGVNNNTNANTNTNTNWVNVLNNKYQLERGVSIHVTCQCCGADIINSNSKSKTKRNRGSSGSSGSSSGRVGDYTSTTAPDANPDIKSNTSSRSNSKGIEGGVEVEYIRHLPSGTFDHVSDA